MRPAFQGRDLSCPSHRRRRRWNHRRLHWRELLSRSPDLARCNRRWLDGGRNGRTADRCQSRLPLFDSELRVEAGVGYRGHTLWHRSHCPVRSAQPAAESLARRDGHSTRTAHALQILPRLNRRPEARTQARDTDLVAVEHVNLNIEFEVDILGVIGVAVSVSVGVYD